MKLSFKMISAVQETHKAMWWRTWDVATRGLVSGRLSVTYNLE